jgi:hypothetical protein
VKNSFLKYDKMRPQQENEEVEMHEITEIKKTVTDCVGH